MMGQLPPRQNALFYEFCLEEQIPDTHLLRRIDQFLDFTQIRKYLEPYYSHTGCPSIDPELMIRMLLVGYCYGIRSERRLCEEIQFNLAYRWFCRLGLEDKIPNHSTFSKTRHGRFRDSDLFRMLFETIVQRSLAEGLIKGEGFAIDGSLIQADVSRQHAASKTEVIDWGPAQQQTRPVREYLEALDDATDRTKPASLSLTDPAARWTASRGKAQFAYSTNYIVDIKCGLIVDVEVSPGNRLDEVACTRTMLERTETNHNLIPDRLMADSAYGTAPLLNYLINEKGIAPHIPVWEKARERPGLFHRSKFIWEADQGCYRCPGGKWIKRGKRAGITKKNAIIYRATTHDCKACEYKPSCCPGVPSKRILRSIYEEARDSTRVINQTDRFKNQSSHERKKVEMAFAHMKRNLNFTRLRLRGMKSANDECILVATAQNLRKLARLRSQPPPDQGVTAS